jgi:drug/metabolite transporter (DMT)-like permease
MEKKQPCVACNWNTKLFIYPILLPISCTFIHFFQEKMFQISNPKRSNKMLKYNVPLLFYYFLPKVFTVIIPLFMQLFSKGESEDEYKNISMRRYHSIAQNENRKKILFLIFFISFLEVIYKIDDSLLYYLQKEKIISLLVEKRSGFIISVPLFSYLILNKKLFRHHIFALIIAVIGVLFINCCRFPLGFSSADDFLYHILNILFSFVFSLSLVLIKYLMTKYLISFISVNMFLFYDGLFCLLNTLICGLLEYAIVINISDKNNDELDSEENSHYFRNNYAAIFLMFQGQEWEFYIYFIFAFLASFCYFFFNIITLYYFTPYINVLTDFMTPCLTMFLTMLFIEPDESINRDNLRKRYIFEFIGYAILFFGALILNEIIIFNFFGLNIDTVSTIRQRGKLDSFDIQNIVPNNPDNDDNDNNSEGELETDGEATSNRS